ncbi:DNA/RNA helicase domain-containing protein [Amycolatopsis sp. WQ 127309]|uniref:DNA/RNA helicase domain-containing protein n=1 Tax=Amycolatopsis sp. WQ 127309 TaxID=2932773 RepID=UPI001FF5724E|nr:DNA/RNA helicase domain-containing protein [Amycolatopsis sp. WQ 127309]UOZ08780.1 DUF2075 domain-containing protein [Amycolatopsis sp. WQ 127309]
MSVRKSAEEMLAGLRANGVTDLTGQLGRGYDIKVDQTTADRWAALLPAFLADLKAAGLGHVDVILHHRLPHSPKHVDIVLSGLDPHTKESSHVLVNLVAVADAEPTVDELFFRDGTYLLSPAKQVHQYCDYLADATPELADRPRSLHGIAYVGDHPANPVAVGQEPPGSPRVFTTAAGPDLHYHLRALIDASSSRAETRRAGDQFLALRQERSVLFKTGDSDGAVHRILRDSFVLLDEQEVAYERVRTAVHNARAGGRPTAVIIMGGPGSGKSAVALNLKRDLDAEGFLVEHATGSRSFTSTLRTFTSSRSQRPQGGFRYFNNYMEATPAELDALICDEAHRIRERSYTRFASKEVRDKAGRQIEELLAAAKVPVFLLDDQQRVRPDELGSREAIMAAARAKGFEVEVIRLAGQFRCGGSDDFEAWVARLVGLSSLPPVKWSSISGPDDEFVVVSAPDPAQLESWLLKQQEQHEGTTARIAAGFCWPWSDPAGTKVDRHLVDDVVIDGWKRPWNAKPDGKVSLPKGIPASHYWATDTRGFGQVGCIYTAQGFEYDWSGVIFGPDFVRRGDEWVADKKGSADTQVRKAATEQFAVLTAQAYKVLLTRGMRGACLYSVDPETQRFLEEMTA